MAHVGQEFALGSIGLLGLLCSNLQFLIYSFQLFI